jgi:hypothetical protein
VLALDTGGEVGKDDADAATDSDTADVLSSYLNTVSSWSTKRGLPTHV